MFTAFIDRTWAPTTLYVAWTYIIWLLRPFITLTLTYGLIALTALLGLRTIYRAGEVERRLDHLGKRAPKIKDYHSPLGLLVLIRDIYYFSRQRSHELWWQHFREAGHPEAPYTVETLVFGFRVVLTADEENIKAVLASQFAEFGKGTQFQKEWNDFLGHSIFTTDGDLWHNSRALLRPQFIKDRVSDLHKFEARTQDLLPLLAGGQTVQIDDLFYRFSLDAATDFLFGKSVDSLINGQIEFAESFREVGRVQALIARAGPFTHWVPRKSFYKALTVLNNFVNQYIDQALQLPQEDLEKITKSDEGYTFLHALASYTRDRKVLRDQIVAVLLAGRDTTAVTLSWLFYELSRHPEVVQRLRQEILKFVGTDGKPTYSDLKGMRYLQHTLNETLRLYPVVPFNLRVALCDTTIPHGGGPDGKEPVAIAKDTAVGYSTYILQHRPDIYPPASSGFPDPEVFVPERWETWTPKNWTFIPFNGGPRICIGQQFALIEMSYVVVRILQSFTRVESRQEEFPKLRSDIVLQPANGVRVAFYRD